MTPAMPLREHEAGELWRSIADPVIQNLVSVGFARALGPFAIVLTRDGQEIPPRLPAEAFDMEFFVRVLRGLFSNLDFIRRILGGELVEPAPIARAPMALNEEAAEQVRLSIDDPVRRNLVTAALNEARRQFGAGENAADDAPAEAPPCSPFDMEFFATVMAEYFELSWMFERLLEGQSPAEASGWD